MADPTDDCLFCAIVAGSIPATRRYEDEHCVAFDDVNPQAPTHVMVVPRVHVTDVAHLAADPDAAAGLLAGIRAFTANAGLSDFRTVFNTGSAVGQTVFHAHAHVLAGRPMEWPPG